MRIDLRKAVIGAAVALAPAVAFAEENSTPAMLEFVGDANPVDGIPRASYIRTTQIGQPSAPSAAGGAPTIFYLNKVGGTFRPGNNDARTNYSSIVDSVSVVPAWNPSAAGWQLIVDCHEELFDRWNVTITDVDPGNVPHYELVIAGSPQDVGMGQGVGGVSPYTYDCSVIPNSIVFTFAEVYGNDYRSICETSAQEIAHSLGLDHEFLCEDPMTYLYNCGDKSFQDIDAQCGEYSARECACGDQTQNSVTWLDERLGVDNGGPANTPPTVSITQPSNGDVVPPTFTVTASAADDVAVNRVEFRVDGALASTDTTAPYSFTTNTLVDGSHTVEARAVDGADETALDTVTVTVDTGAPEQPDAGPGGGDPDAGPGGGGGGDDDPDDDGYITGGCASSGGAVGALTALSVLALVSLFRLGRRRHQR